MNFRGLPSFGSAACWATSGSSCHEKSTRFTATAPAATAARDSTVPCRDASDASEKASIAKPVAAIVVAPSRPRSGACSRRRASQLTTVRRLGGREAARKRRRPAKNTREPTAATAATTSGGTSRSSGPSVSPAAGGRVSRPTVAEAATTTSTTTQGIRTSGRPSRRRVSIRVATAATAADATSAASSTPALHRAADLTTERVGVLEPTVTATTPRAATQPASPASTATGSSSAAYRSPADTGRRPVPAASCTSWRRRPIEYPAAATTSAKDRAMPTRVVTAAPRWAADDRTSARSDRSSTPLTIEGRRATGPSATSERVASCRRRRLTASAVRWNWAKRGVASVSLVWADHSSWSPVCFARVAVVARSATARWAFFVCSWASEGKASIPRSAHSGSPAGDWGVRPSACTA